MHIAMAMTVDRCHGIGMKVVAVYNNKGGIGKTTFSAHIAIYAAGFRIRTLAVGLDRQGDLVRWLAGGDCALQDGTSFRKGEHLSVLYSPMELPDREFMEDYELVVVDCPPNVEIVDSLTADLWIVPLDGRLAMENLGNIYGTLRSADGEIYIVLNRCDMIGKRALEGLKRAAHQIPHATVRPKPIPSSAAIAKAAEYFRPVWEVPYGRKTYGAKAVRGLCDDVLRASDFGGRL